MSVKVFCHSKLDELAPAHKAAFRQAERISYDLSLSWFSNLYATTLGSKGKIKIYGAEDNDGRVVILPMYYDDSITKPRKLKSWVNFYTSLYAPISSQGVTAELLRHALTPLKNDIIPWDEIDFSPLSMEDESFNALFEALRRSGMIPFKYYCFGNWYLPVCGRSYESYHEGLPSRLKNTIKRKGKQFFANGVGRLEIILGGDKMETGIADYKKVYATSWKVEEPYPDFISGLVHTCADRGWLRLGIAYLCDEPVAAQIWIVAHGRAAIYKLAYDEKFASYSAGSILSSHMMRYALDVDKVDEVDYLIGDDPYKKDWMSHHRERWGIVAYNPRTLTGLAGFLKQILGEWVRSFSSNWNSFRLSSQQ